jgi:hypothetical protein
MGILFRVRKTVVHAVHHAIRVRAEVGRALEDVGKDKKRLFPGLGHREELMGRIAVVEEALEEERNVPVDSKKYQYSHDNQGFPQNAGGV